MTQSINYFKQATCNQFEKAKETAKYALNPINLTTQKTIKLAKLAILAAALTSIPTGLIENTSKRLTKIGFCFKSLSCIVDKI